VQEDGRQEVAVREGRGAGSEVLRETLAQGSPAFKKACGTTEDQIQVH